MTTGGATADVNWYLATLAQVTATLVAIIGGLLVARLVTLSTLRAAAADREQAASAGLVEATTAAKRCLDARDALERLNVEAATHQTLIDSLGGDRDAAALLVEVDTRLGPDEARKAVEETRAKVRLWFSTISDAARRTQMPDPWPTTFDKGVERLNLPVPPEARMVAEAVYHRLRRDRETGAAQGGVIAAEQLAGRAFEAGMSARPERPLAAAPPADAARPPRPSTRARPVHAYGDADRGKLEAARRASDDADNRVADCDRHREAAAAAVGAVTPGDATWPAVAGLVWLGLWGMLVPLGLLARKPSDVDGVWRYGTFACFALGVAWLTRVLVTGLRSKGADNG